MTLANTSTMVFGIAIAMLAGCGSGAGETATDAAPGYDVGASVDTLSTASHEWQVFVEPSIDEDRRLEPLIVTPKGVIVLTNIDAVSFDSTGAEIGRARIRDWQYGDSYSFVGSVVHENRVFMAFMLDPEDVVVVVSFAADDLGQRQLITLKAKGTVALAGKGGAAYLLVSDRSDVVMYRLGETQVDATRVISKKAYRLSLDGIQLNDGRLLFCAGERDTDQLRLLFVDVDAGVLTVSPGVIGPPGIDRCNLTRGRDTIIATWISATQRDGLLISPADGSVVRSAPTGPVEHPSGINTDTAFDDDDWLRITWRGIIVRYGATTLMPLTSYRFDFPAGATPFYGSASVVSDESGTSIYAALPYYMGLSQVILVLQKLETIAGP